MDILGRVEDLNQCRVLRRTEPFPAVDVFRRIRGFVVRRLLVGRELPEELEELEEAQQGRRPRSSSCSRSSHDSCHISESRGKDTPGHSGVTRSCSSRAAVAQGVQPGPQPQGMYRGLPGAAGPWGGVSSAGGEPGAPGAARPRRDPPARLPGRFRAFQMRVASRTAVVATSRPNVGSRTLMASPTSHRGRTGSQGVVARVP